MIAGNSNSARKNGIKVLTCIVCNSLITWKPAESEKQSKNGKAEGRLDASFKVSLLFQDFQCFIR